MDTWCDQCGAGVRKGRDMELRNADDTAWIHYFCSLGCLLEWVKKTLGRS